MTASRLRLNASKTQVVWLGSRHNLDRVTVSEVQVLTSTVRVVSSARVVIDSRLTMADYVASVCLSAYYRLRQIRPTVQSLTPDGSKTLVQAFISGRLDYCNSLLNGMTDSLFQRLQSVQNTATRLITRTGRREHITPVLRELHCMLPVRHRVDFKLATFMYKTLHGRIPRYLSNDCQLISDPSRRLRLSDTFTFAVPRPRTRLGDRSCCCWTTDMEQSALVHNYARFRLLLKRHYVWLRLRRLVTLCFGRRVQIYFKILFTLVYLFYLL